MAAKIGILGESTVVTVNTLTTVYTVPADKAARVRVLFMLVGGAGAFRYKILIGSPGSEAQIARLCASGDDLLSGMNGAGSIASNTVGLVDPTGQINPGWSYLSDEGDYMGVPYPHDYFLSTGDTVRFYIMTTAAVAHLIQVVGVEDDA